jgi:hypothetical protein
LSAGQSNPSDAECTPAIRAQTDADVTGAPNLIGENFGTFAIATLQVSKQGHTSLLNTRSMR